MAHMTVKDGYRSFADRLNLAAQGAPPTDLLFRTLKVLISESDAALMAQLPLRPFRGETAARNWKVSLVEAQKTLDRLCASMLLVDLETPDGFEYWLPPPMVGFFEFSMMRVRGDIDQHLLSELLHAYVIEEGDFMRVLMGTPGTTPFHRFLVNEQALPQDPDHNVLDYERASEIIRQASSHAVGQCYCRHIKQHLGTACDTPLELCLSLGSGSDTLVRHGYARRIDVVECLELLSQAHDRNLVQFSENEQKQPGFICNCCGCCCEALQAVRKFGMTGSIGTTNFLPAVSADCTGCSKCVNACPVGAMTLVSAHDPAKPGRRTAKLDDRICLGCGICAKVCPNKQVVLKFRPKRLLTPVDMMQRTILMALERGKLQNLVFDNPALASHRVLAVLLGAVLRLPPVKQAMVNQQLKSIYLSTMIELSKHGGASVPG